MRYLIFHRNEASACFIIHNRMQLFTDYFSILALAFALQISENNFLSNEKWLVARVRFSFCLIDILRSFVTLTYMLISYVGILTLFSLFLLKQPPRIFL